MTRACAVLGLAWLASSFVITARLLPGVTGRAFRIDEKGELTEIK
ncbi:MAG: hypothetical protein AB7H93_09685 [Vicinamibacterales bacterium]